VRLGEPGRHQHDQPDIPHNQLVMVHTHALQVSQ
jgi:hypothetical protein